MNVSDYNVYRAWGACHLRKYGCRVTIATRHHRATIATRHHRATYPNPNLAPSPSFLSNNIFPCVFKSILTQVPPLAVTDAGTDSVVCAAAEELGDVEAHIQIPGHIEATLGAETIRGA
jgi:hypothetical protein